jgi:hypothetical protein
MKSAKVAHISAFGKKAVLKKMMFLIKCIMFQSVLSCHPSGIHSHTILNIPEYISEEAKSFLKEVCYFHCSSHN